MRWRMVHQEKRVYQVCVFVFVCARDSDGGAWQVQVNMRYHGQAAVRDIMDECEVTWVCSYAIFTCVSLGFYTSSVQFEIVSSLIWWICVWITRHALFHRFNEITLHHLQWQWGAFLWPRSLFWEGTLGCVCVCVWRQSAAKEDILERLSGVDEQEAERW